MASLLAGSFLMQYMAVGHSLFYYVLLVLVITKPTLVLEPSHYKDLCMEDQSIKYTCQFMAAQFYSRYVVTEWNMIVIYSV